MRRLLTAAFLSASFFQSKADPSYLDTVIVLSYVNDTIKLSITTDFLLGSGPNCPHITFVNFAQSGDSLILNVYYNIYGSWQAAGCFSTDTVSIGKLTGIKTIHVFPYTYANNDTEIGYHDKIISTTTSVTTFGRLLFKSTPNPFSDQLNIEQAKGAKIEVFDIAGRTVYKSIITHDKEPVDTGAWQQGMYILQLSDDEGNRVNKKVIKW